MPSWLDSIFETADATARTRTAQENARQVAAFRAALGNEARVRLYVGTGGGTGNQAATVDLLRRLVSPHTDDHLTYGYAGTVDVHYAGDTRENLLRMLPELRGEDTGRVVGATVNLVPYDAHTPPSEAARFGFTGAVDESNLDLAASLNVEYFLQLQPYNCRYAERLWFGDGRDALDLRRVELLNNPSFARRVFYLAPASYAHPDWSNEFTDADAQIVRYLTGDDILRNVRLVVCDAIMQPAQNVIDDHPDSAATILCGGLLQSQSTGEHRLAAPVVVLNLNDYGAPDDDSHLQRVASLLRGDPTAQEQTTVGRGDPQAVAHYRARRSYMRSLGSADRFSYLNYPTTLDALREAVAGFAGHRDRVLFVQLGRIVQPLYYYLLSKTNYFSLFEGTNSTMAAVSMGKPFLALPRLGSGASPDLYPNISRGGFSSSPPIGALASAANQLNFNLESWPSRASSNPCRVLGAFLQRLANEIQATDPIPKYFADLQRTYATSNEDKLNVAIAYLMTALAAPALRRLTGVPATAEAAPSGALQSLYTDLKAKVAIDKKLDLVPGVLAGGNINEVVLAILKGHDASLWLEVETFDHLGPEDNVTQISLTGTTGVFQGLEITNDLSIVFDAPQGELRSTVRFGSDGAWSIPGVPWIRMSSPYLEIQVSDAALPIAARVGGNYEPLGAGLSVVLPVTEGQWLAMAEFRAPYPGIDKAFQIAAGVNLTRMLPPPLNAIADLGVDRIELYYESETENVSSLGFVVKRQDPDAEPIPLVGKISLDAIEIDIALVNPKVSREVEVSAGGQFTIGKGPDAGIVTVSTRYPDFQFKGGLTSGVIALPDLIETFIPGVKLAPPHAPRITEFEFSYERANDALSVSMALNISWTFVFLEKELFELEDVRFAITRAGGDNSGYVLGRMTILPDSARIGLSVGAYHAGKGNWIFAAKQTGGEIDLSALLKQYLGPAWAPDGFQFPRIIGLGVTITWVNGSANAWAFTAKTTPWPMPFDSGITVSAQLRMGDHGMGGEAGASAGKSGRFAEISADIRWCGIDLQIAYVYQSGDPSYRLSFGEFSGTLEERASPHGDGKRHWVATVGFAKDTTLGTVVETLVSWATGSRFGLAPPWNVLDGIRLSDVALVYDFNAGTVGFKIDVGPIELGFARLSAIKLSYESPDAAAKRKVMVELEGTFAWNVGRPHEPIRWDATDPASTKAPPGGGNRYLDLRLLAMGQHVTVKGIEQADTVQQAIELMAELPEPSAGEIPPVKFAPDSRWLIGADLQVLKIESDDDDKKAASTDKALVESGGDQGGDSGYVLTLQIVFNDPMLYGLRIALAGEQAKIFAGLDFQIMYRKISDTLGVYQAEIALPTVMRRFDVGAYSVTLPVFGIEVYTDGGFKVDIGFPWHEDFSRSFTVEAVVPVGPVPIPLLGAGGFYLGKLAQAAVPEVPRARNGSFNPVLVFGFGAQVGLGKSIEAGVLRAGFRLTVFGIVEGVLAKWNPHQASQSGDSGSQQLQGQYFFSLTGTVGIIGQVYGTVDFVVVKAEVRIEIMVYAQITYASYEPIPISVVASVDVRASIRISLGLFHITVHFSFSMRLKETFTIENSGDPPWQVEAPAAKGLLAAPVCARLRDARPSTRALGAMATRPPDWSMLRKPDVPAELTGYLVPGLTVAGDMASKLSEQVPCYVVNLLIDSVPPAGEDTEGSTRKAAGEAKDTPFETLCKLIARWGVAAQRHEALTPQEVDGLVVEATDLRDLLTYLSRPDDNPIPIPAQDIESFLTAQVTFALLDPTAQTTGGKRVEVDATYFPMPPGIGMKISDYGDRKGFDYSFADYNTVSDSFASELREYFNRLAVQVQQDDGVVRRTAAVAEPGGSHSVASFVFGDYFLLLMRQMVQAMLDGLRDYKYPVAGGESPDEVVAWVNEMQLPPGSEVREEGYTLHDLFASNTGHVLSAQKRLTITGGRYTVQPADTFDSIARQAAFGGAFDASALATLNQYRAGLLRGGAQITYQGRRIAISEGDAVDSLARRLGSSAPEVIAHSDILSAEVLAPLAETILPPYPYETQGEDTLSKIVARTGATLEDLATDDNAGVADLFSAEHEADLDIAHLTKLRVSALLAEAQRTLALQHLSGMASRYYFHGLRLPTEEITANALGMWVRELGESGKPGHAYELPLEAGLFALTGQQVPLPVLEADKDFTITLSREGGTKWLEFPTGDASTITVKPGAEDALRIDALRDYAGTHRLDLQTRGLDAQSAVGTRPATYPLSTAISWSSTEAMALPTGTAAARLTVLPLPASLAALPDRTRRIDPRFAVQVHRYDEATSATRDEPIASYGWASMAEFTVKRVPASAASPTSAATYEIIGTSARDVVILERLIERVGANDADLFAVTVAFATPAVGGKTGLQTPAASKLTLGIAQANLSTQTRPPAAPRGVVALSAEAPTGPNLLNRKTEFVRLLWEAGITRAGGFFLYYFDEATGEGLPDRIFNDKDEAVLTLLALHAVPAVAEKRDRVSQATSAVVVGDALDLSRATLVAQADPMPHKVASEHPIDAAGNLPDLATIAHGYFSNVADIADAETNAGLKLTPGLALKVRDGRYLVSPTRATPGGRLADIAEHFRLEPAAIKAANPSLTAFYEPADWPDPLPDDRALRLPEITLTVGAGPGGDTLASIAHYYGVSPAGLAAHNAEVPGLFAAGQAITVPAGPTVRAPSVAPGVQALAADRPQPPDPGPPALAQCADPSAPAEFALAHLRQTYSMLGLRVVGNQDFEESGMGLPAGPQTDPPASTDKIRAPRERAAGDAWQYRKSVPYTAFSKSKSSATSPYRGNGTLLQLDFSWQDLYGNRIITTLSQPEAGDQGAVNRTPVLIGYTDTLIALGQWPSVSSGWSVTPAAQGGRSQLALALDFSPNAFLPPGDRRLAPDESGSDHWQENAKRARPTLERLVQQLTDPCGIDFRIETTLLPAPLTLTVEQADALVSWAQATEAFVAGRADGKDSPPPARAPAKPIATDVDRDAIEPAEIFRLTLDFVIERSGGVVDGNLQTVRGVRRVATRIAPAVGDSESGTDALWAFARDFSQALSTDGCRLAVATGVDRTQSSARASPAAIWVVRLGAEAIHYTVRTPDHTKGLEQLHTVFAPRPLSNQLISRSDVPISHYGPDGTDLDKPDAHVAFRDVDLDVWGAQLFAAIDDLLTPTYTSAMLVVDDKTSRPSKHPDGYLGQLLAHKEALADIVSRQMIPVYEDQPAQSEAQQATVQEAFRQQLLIALRNAYATRAAVGFVADVKADVAPGPDTSAPPRLYGAVTGEIPSEVSLTSTKLVLETTAPDDPAPLALLVSAPRHLRIDGAVVPEVKLDGLAFDGSAIEHQIGEVAEIEGYLASSWLRLIDPAGAGLAQDLGSVTVPLVLRSFPATPSMLDQSGVTSHPEATKLAELTEWNYAFTYALEFHYPQDRVHGEIKFNVARSRRRTLAGLQDAFDALAQFVTVYPEVKPDLTGVLAGLDPGSDEAAVDKAATALGAFNAMVDKVVRQAGSAGLVAVGGPAVNAEDTYRFTVAEGSGKAKDCDRSLLVTICGTPLPGMAAPVVSVGRPGTYTAHLLADGDGAYTYYFEDDDGKILPADKGQTIRERTVSVENLQILQHQNAWASVRLKRNEEIGGQPIAEPFVYMTNEVRFANEHLPTIRSDAAVDIAVLGTRDGKPAKRSLAAHLAALFDDLLTDAELDTVTIQIEAFYEYALNPTLSPIVVPVLMQPPLIVDRAAQKETAPTPTAAMVSDLVAGIERWFRAHEPAALDASLSLSLTCMSNMTEEAMPLLRLGGLSLALEYVHPPLPIGQ
jgi:hypothetical protein